MSNVNTFGSSEAAMILVQEIGNDSKMMRRVGRILSQFNNCMNEVSKIKNHFVNSYILQTVYDETIKRVRETLLPDKVKSFLLNVIHTKYLSTHNRCGFRIPKKVRLENA